MLSLTCKESNVCANRPESAPFCKTHVFRIRFWFWEWAFWRVWGEILVVETKTHALSFRFALIVALSYV